MFFWVDLKISNFSVQTNNRMIIIYQLANFRTWSLFEFRGLVCWDCWELGVGCFENLNSISTKIKKQAIYSGQQKHFNNGGYNKKNSRNSTHPNQLWLKLHSRDWTFQPYRRRSRHCEVDQECPVQQHGQARKNVVGTHVLSGINKRKLGLWFLWRMIGM